MPIALFRVDERLIHGQVTVGWGSVIHPQHYVVVDDELAESDWESELYSLGVPSGSRASFLSVEEARERLPSLKTGPEVAVLLTRSISNMAELGREGDLEGEQINLGGVHHASGRSEVLPYLYLGHAERQAIITLCEAGATVTARDLPNAPRVGSKRLLQLC